MDERPRYYVYVLFRENGQPFYVGKGARDRLSAHLAPSSEKGRMRNQYKTNIIRAMLERGLDVPRVKVAQQLTEAQAFEVERAFIIAIGRVPNGSLVNMSDGGEGHSGRKLSEAHRTALMEGKKRQVTTPESRARMSAAQKGFRARLGKKNSAAHNEALRVANLGNKHCLGRICSAETRQKISAAKKGKPVCPIVTEALVAKVKGIPLSPEHRAKISAALERSYREGRRKSQRSPSADQLNLPF